jgi:hypothetical protein
MSVSLVEELALLLGIVTDTRFAEEENATYEELAMQAGPEGPREDVFYEMGNVSYLYNKALDEFERVSRDDGTGLTMRISRSCAQDAQTKRLSLIEVRVHALVVPGR